MFKNSYSKTLISKRKYAKNSVREVTNFAKGDNNLPPFAKFITALCFTDEERK